MTSFEVVEGGGFSTSGAGGGGAGDMAAAAPTPVVASKVPSCWPWSDRYALICPLLVPWNTRPPAVDSVPSPIVPWGGVRHTSCCCTGSHAISCDVAARGAVG